MNKKKRKKKRLKREMKKKKKKNQYLSREFEMAIVYKMNTNEAGILWVHTQV